MFLKREHFFMEVDGRAYLVKYNLEKESTLIKLFVFFSG